MVLKITVKNWAKYQGEKRIKNAHWFKFSNKTFRDHKIRSLTPEELRVWLYLLCEVSSENNGGRCTVEVELMATDLAIETAAVKKAIKKLKHFQLLEPKDSSSRYTNVVPEEEREREREREQTREKSAKSSSVDDWRVLFEIWNTGRRGMLPAKGWNSKREAAARARWQENPSKQYWSDIVSQMSLSDFCTGGGERGWIATFDFFLAKDTHSRVLEGEFGGATQNSFKTVSASEVYKPLEDSPNV